MIKGEEMKENQIRVYTEVFCILDCFPEWYTQKLPAQLVELIKKSVDPKYLIENKEDFDIQNISKETKIMLAVLRYNYWSTEEEKKQIEKRLVKNEEEYLKEQREKYNPDDIFKKKDTNEIVKENLEQNNLPIVREKKKIFGKIIEFIKTIFE